MSNEWIYRLYILIQMNNSKVILKATGKIMMDFSKELEEQKKFEQNLNEINFINNLIKITNKLVILYKTIHLWVHSLT